MSTLAYAKAEDNGACFTTVNPNQAATGSPARMADGRLFTDYRPRCFQYPLKASQTWGENDARLRMIHGADELMEAARQMNNRKATATKCVDTMTPELYKRVCTYSGCKTVPGHFAGIGVGRIYVPSLEGAAAEPQQLSDATVPALFGTYARDGPTNASQCALGDPEQAWFLKNAQGTAKSHPYSGPRA
jgi:hypothetical protein